MNLTDPIAAGNTAKVYLHENRVVKVFHSHLPEGEAAVEANKQILAHSCGLPVPEIVGVTKIDGRQAIIMEYVKGRTLGELAEADRASAEYFMSLSVDVQLKIHTNSADSLEPMSEKLTRQINASGELSQKQKYLLLGKLASMSNNNRLCHGDFHLNNLIMSKHDVTIIDWVDSSSGNIPADVYRSYLLYSQVSSKLAELYLRLYCQKSGLQKEQVLDWGPIIAGARLSENVSSERSGRLLKIVDQYCTAP
ncbi:aminoglycoside phosphotransferase family protein [Mangrovibacillus sp. Mu-81]|jgi:aminoglycoside phosphotransferase (APT) family kinase protein|uniref:phosphotransferase family protein n=1 Tax=Mangrovibacillus sp. Mu-81 TaxID=3121478 RepID=UPI002FE49544